MYKKLSCTKAVILGCSIDGVINAVRLINVKFKEGI
jgi:hypothetical protein